MIAKYTVLQLNCVRLSNQVMTYPDVQNDLSVCICSGLAYSWTGLEFELNWHRPKGRAGSRVKINSLQLRELTLNNGECQNFHKSHKSSVLYEGFMNTLSEWLDVFISS